MTNSDLSLAHGGNLDWAARLVGCTPPEILDFSASINPLGMPASVRAAIWAALPQVYAYPDRDYQDLRQAIADYHQIDPTWVMPGNGAAELLTWAARNLADANTGLVGLVRPAFGDYDRALLAQGVTGLPLGFDFTPVAPGILALWQGAWGRSLLLNNPHNPTGKLWQRSELLPLLDRFKLVVIDEAFMDFLADRESLIQAVESYPNLVILRSLTKFYGLPGLRIGYAIAAPARLQRWQKWRDPWSVNVLAQAAAIAGLADLEFQQRTWAWLPTAREHLFNGLTQIPGLEPQPSAANFILVKTRVSSLALRQYLLFNHRILIRDCQSFPELGDRYFRVCVHTIANQTQLLAALAQAVTELDFNSERSQFFS
ncbi:MAG: threonine-phosphate decarboxylase CobD [Pseudanabaenaceae cyanobacterium bins.68]|nr:threonine-phosphate decarboxylase CobD [Pseudanabaenaceae cyanobacterium bins.68]